MINSTNSEYAISHESELAYILSKFNNDFIYNTLNESLTNKLRVNGFSLPNMVVAFEMNFENVKQNYPDCNDEIVEVRNTTYENIIQLLCDAYQLSINTDEVDLYNISKVMYEILVSAFQQSVISFFINFIYNEKDSIYSMLNLTTKKRNKDTSTLYARKAFIDPKIGIISANLEFVIDSICTSFDISFDTYIKYVYIDNPDKYNLLINSLSPVNDFFRTYIGSVFKSEFGPILISSVRLLLQKDMKNILDISEDITL